MNKKESYYKVGHIANPLKIKVKNVVPKGRICKIIIPARVNTFLCHHKYFAHPPKPQIYPVNSINFGISKFTEAKVEIRDDNKNIIDASDKHVVIIEHVIKIMQKTLGIENGFNVNAKSLHNISHGGLGSSSAVASAVTQAINILMGNVLSVGEITKLISQNYVEESPKKGFISSAASIGGSTAIGLSGKSLVIMGGNSEIWFLGDLPKDYCAVLLYPKKMKSISKAMDNELNKKEFSLLETVDEDWGDVKEKMLKLKIIPAIKKGNYSVLFRVINMYTVGAFGDIPNYFSSRWATHGVKFDSLIFTIFSKLFPSLKIDENCFFVSSNGPLIAIITNQPKRILSLLRDLDKNFFIERVALNSKIDYQLEK